ncbi:hypothetical protein JCM10213_006450, partial [Rhodosporidiobolus nylandii]
VDVHRDQVRRREWERADGVLGTPHDERDAAHGGGLAIGVGRGMRGEGARRLLEEEDVDSAEGGGMEETGKDILLAVDVV